MIWGTLLIATIFKLAFCSTKCSSYRIDADKSWCSQSKERSLSLWQCYIWDYLICFWKSLFQQQIKRALIQKIFSGVFFFFSFFSCIMSLGALKSWHGTSIAAACDRFTSSIRQYARGASRSAQSRIRWSTTCEYWFKSPSKIHCSDLVDVCMTMKIAASYLNKKILVSLPFSILIYNNPCVYIESRHKCSEIMWANFGKCSWLC